MKDWIKIFTLFLGVFTGMFTGIALYGNSHKIEASIRCYLDMPDSNKMRDYSCYPLTKEEMIKIIENETAVYETANKLNRLTQNN